MMYIHKDDVKNITKDRKNNQTPKAEAIAHGPRDTKKQERFNEVAAGPESEVAVAELEPEQLDHLLHHHHHCFAKA